MTALNYRTRQAPSKGGTLNRIALFGLFYSAAFAFFYIEPVKLGPINFASFWKIVAFAFVFILVIMLRRYQFIPKVALFGILFAGVSLLNPSLFMAPAETVSEALKYLYVPLIFTVLYGLHRKHNFTSETLLYFATHVSIFIAISGIPFVVGALEPIASKGGYDLSIFGLEGIGFNGIFFHSHGASIVMGTAAIVLIWAAKHSSKPSASAFFVFLAVFALYCVVQTYARTGYALAAFGVVLVIYYPFRAVKLLAITPLAIIAVFFTASAVIDNEALMMRLQGKNIYTIASGSGDLTSGRTRFWVGAVDSFVDSPPREWAFGAGPYLGKERMRERVNLRISAHNDFINALLFSGIVGLVLYLVFTFYLIRVAWRVRRNPLAGDLTIALVGSYLVQMVLQGERMFLSELILVLVIFGAAIGSGSISKET